MSTYAYELVISEYRRVYSRYTRRPCRRRQLQRARPSHAAVTRYIDLCPSSNIIDDYDDDDDVVNVI